MNIMITEQLKSMRKEHGNTQEELANHLSISVQAVSKWERGDGYPDISLLPSIAFYYGTTVDDLLGVGEIEKQNKIEAYMKAYKENANVGKINANIILMRKAAKEFPKNLDIMDALMHALFFIDKEEYLDEVIIIGETILSKSVVDEQRYNTIQTLAYAYDKKNMSKKAIEYAEKLPDLYCTKNTVLEAIMTGDELHELTQENIRASIRMIDMSVTWMLRSKEYSSDEKIFAYETIEKLYNLFLYDGNYGYESGALFEVYMNLSREYAKTKNREKTIESVNAAYTFAKVMDDFPTGKYTSIFSDSGKYSKKDFSENFESAYVGWLKNVINEKMFDFVREDNEFKSIIC